MLQKTIDEQEGYYWLDSKPHTVTSKSHRPAYGSDGDYWSKPNKEIVFRAVYEIMNEINPGKIALNFSEGSEIADGITYGMYLTIFNMLKEIGYENKIVRPDFH